MSREETSTILHEILVTSRAIVELDDDGSFSREIRARRRALLAKLRAEGSGSEDPR